MANTTWSATDKLAVTLSGTNNLTATTTAVGGVRTADAVSVSGRFYFEYTCTSWNSANVLGVANASAALGSVAGNVINAAIVNFAGQIAVNNTTVQGTLGARANGNIIGTALDLTSSLIWFRVAPAGNWNGSGTANPATGAGGFSTTPIGPKLFGLFAATGGSGQNITANFGDSAFSGTVPAGFTAGFPVPTRAAPRQALIM